MGSCGKNEEEEEWFDDLLYDAAYGKSAKEQKKSKKQFGKKKGMEPVKGGTLADPPETVKSILRAADPKASIPSWAIRFAASLDGVITVLSGMSDLEQMKDNVSYMKNFKPLDERQMEAVRKAQEALKAVNTIPCTACHYCTAGCPQHICIPDIFTARNILYLYGNKKTADRKYASAVNGGGKASDCIACGQCENAC